MLLLTALMKHMHTCTRMCIHTHRPENRRGGSWEKEDNGSSRETQTFLHMHKNAIMTLVLCVIN